jgi:hypothetical protein
MLQNMNMSGKRFNVACSVIHENQNNSLFFTFLFRIFVSTWNVGGKAPTAELKLDDFLPVDDHSDIYVLG